MTRQTGNRSRWAVGAAAAMVVGGVALVVINLSLSPIGLAISRLSTARSFEPAGLAAPSYTPWSSIGGCGAGGSGGSGGGGIKWVGRGVTGGLLDFQLLNTYSIGQNSQGWTFPARFSIKPTYTTVLGLTVPVESKIGVLQPQTNQTPSTEVTGGLGDVSVDLTKTVGAEGQYALTITLSLPTGQYDIQRGSDGAYKYLPTSLQKGAGTYSATFGLGYTKDIENGVILADGSLAWPFAVSFTGKNPYNDTWGYDVSRMSARDKARFEYWFKPYGENDLGGYTAPSLSFDAYYGNKFEKDFMYSFGVTFGCPLGVNWIPSYKPEQYDPIPDPDFQAWNASLNYGMEFCNMKYPFIIGVTLPIHDKSNPPSALDVTQKYNAKVVGQWSGPDWKDFGQAWTLSFGVKASMF